MYVMEMDTEHERWAMYIYMREHVMEMDTEYKRRGARSAAVQRRRAPPEGSCGRPPSNAPLARVGLWAAERAPRQHRPQAARPSPELSR